MGGLLKSKINSPFLKHRDGAYEKWGGGGSENVTPVGTVLVIFIRTLWNFPKCNIKIQHWAFLLLQCHDVVYMKFK